QEATQDVERTRLDRTLVNVLGFLGPARVPLTHRSHHTILIADVEVHPVIEDAARLERVHRIDDALLAHVDEARARLLPRVERPVLNRLRGEQAYALDEDRRRSAVGDTLVPVADVEALHELAGARLAH